jgi:hypothetical protein
MCVAASHLIELQNMIPIFEQGAGRGIGHDLVTFLERFDEICDQKTANGSDKAFGFIFYDFRDETIRQVLSDDGVFARLDRLADENLSVFYLHAGSKEAIRSFNAYFLRALGIKERASLPCMVFFRVHDGKIRDVEVAQLEISNLHIVFHELYVAIERYRSPSCVSSSAPPHSTIRWLKDGAQFISLEVFRAALGELLLLFFRG